MYSSWVVVKIKHENTEFLFESDAEKVVLKEAEEKLKAPKRPNIALKIFLRSSFFSLVILAAAYFSYSYTQNQVSKVKASLGNIVEKENKFDEKLSSAGAKLITYNFSGYDKYAVVINKVNPISEDALKNYKIVDVSENSFEGIKLEEETYNNYLNLKRDLLDKGYYINIRSGYRSFNESSEIYNNYVATKGEIYADKYVAKAGTSEHNSGMAIDFVISSVKNATTNNYESDEYFYLQNVAYLYGFIIRYPKDKESVTGYAYEPWHLRYVGKDLAKFLKKNNLTLEEYYNIKGA